MKTHEPSADHDLLPRTADTNDPLSPREQPGYYPDYSTLEQRSFWEKATRELVVQRVESPPPLRFFTEAQAQFWQTVFEHLLPQADRTPERRIPLIPPLDERLHENRTVGYRYENMPHDRDVYGSIGMDAIDREALNRYGKEFLSLPWREQDLALRFLHDGDPLAAKDIWEKMSVHRFWQMIIQDAIEAYYSHPWAWDEIGYGGPAYPRAYTRLERGDPEPWEVEEQRYQWQAPPAAVSDDVDDASDHHLESEQLKHKPVRSQ
jgi:hypothetical protein